MSNLGDSNTPISGELFGLPSGWNLTENNDGEAVFEDTQGNVVLRRDATNNRWVTDEIDASSATLDVLNTADLASASQGELLQISESPPQLDATSINVGASSTVTAPDESPPSVGDRGDLWTPLINVGGGSKIWDKSFALARGGIAEDLQKVYAADGGILTAINKSIGSVAFEFDTNENIASGVAVDSDAVYFGLGSGNYAFFAVDTADGSELWSFTNAANNISSDVVLDDSAVYFGEEGGKIYSLDKSDGSENWSFTTGGAISAIAIDNAAIYARSDDELLYSIDKSNGTENWTYDTDGLPRGGLAVDGSNVYVGAGFEGDVATAADISDGSEVWTTTVNGTISSGIGQDGSNIYFGTRNNPFAYSLAKSDGTQNWEVSFADRIRSDVVVSEATVYLGANTSNFYALNTSDGTERWRFETGGNVESEVAIGDKGVYFASTDDTVYALRIGRTAYDDIRVSDGTEWINVI